MRIQIQQYISFIISLGFLVITPSYLSAQYNNLEGFETGMGIWIDGGADAFRKFDTSIGLDGNYSVRLRDNSGVGSSIFSSNLDLSNYNLANISFQYKAVSMEPGEDFLLEYSADGGTTFDVLKSYVSGIDFQNDQFKNETFALNQSLSAFSVFRFRCDASSNFDQIFLDQIFITASGGVQAADCPALNANIGDACNDGDPNTSNDTVNASCQCVGTTIPVQSPECSGRITCLNINTNSTGILKNINGAEFCSDRFSSSDISIAAEVNGAHESMNFIIESPRGTFTYLDNSASYNSSTFIARTKGKYKLYAKLYSQDNKGGTLCDQSHIYFTLDDCVVTPDCPQLNANIGDICDDNNPFTINDVVDDNCNCVGTSYDCPTLYANIGDACDDGNPNTINDTVNDSCSCQGTPVTGGCTHSLITYQGFENGLGAWTDGGGDAYRVYDPGFSVAGNHAMRLRDNSGVASSIFYDNLNLLGASEVKVDFSFIAASMEVGEDLFLEYSTDGVNYQLVQSWVSGTDFNNSSVNSESVTFSRNFSATTSLRFRCDASSNYDAVYLDEISISACSRTTSYDCPDLNANIGDTCNDGNPNTTNDLITASCTCQGTIINTGCNYQVVHSNGFESGLGEWNDGGGDAIRINDSSYATAGNYAFRIRDNSGFASSMYSDPLNFLGVNEVKVDFSFIAQSMEPGEDFLLEYSNDGTNYTTLAQWASGIDFQNGQQISESVSFSDSFTDNTVLRFRCDASSNYDAVYLDEITVSACGGAYWASDDLVHSEEVLTDIENTLVLDHAGQATTSLMKIYPNPIAGHTLYMNVETSEAHRLSGSIYTQFGDKVMDYNDIKLEKGSSVHRLDVDALSAGAYILIVEIGTEVFYEKIVIVK